MENDHKIWAYSLRQRQLTESLHNNFFCLHHSDKKGFSSQRKDVKSFTNSYNAFGPGHRRMMPIFYTFQKAFTYDVTS